MIEMNKRRLVVWRRYVFLDQVQEPKEKRLPFIESICKMATSKTQVNFDMQHNHTLCTSANTQSVWKLGLHTGSKDQKVSYILQIYTHWFCSIILLYWFTPSLLQKVGNLIANIVLLKSTAVMASKWQHYKLCHTAPHSKKCHVSSVTCFKCVFFIHRFHKGRE